MPLEIPVEVRGLVVDPTTNMPIVVLREQDGPRVLPIWVGVFEANAIALEMEGVTTPRPMTHDLMRRLVEQLQGKIERVVVWALKENTFYALIYLDAGLSEAVAIDARPSDAIALALRTKSPIFVEDAVLQATKTGEATGVEDIDRVRQWLEALKEEDWGKYKM